MIHFGYLDIAVKFPHKQQTILVCPHQQAISDTPHCLLVPPGKHETFHYACAYDSSKSTMPKSRNLQNMFNGIWRYRQCSQELLPNPFPAFGSAL